MKTTTIAVSVETKKVFDEFKKRCIIHQAKNDISDDDYMQYLLHLAEEAY